MLSVHEAAVILGVSDARVRALLKDGGLEGTKIGRTWAVSERSVAKRRREGARPGRPTKNVRGYERTVPDVDEAHRIYDDAARVLAGCYDAAFLDQARTPEEQAFWIRVADFFLQKRQRELVEEDVF